MIKPQAANRDQYFLSVYHYQTMPKSSACVISFNTNQPHRFAAMGHLMEVEMDAWFVKKLVQWAPLAPANKWQRYISNAGFLIEKSAVLPDSASSRKDHEKPFPHLRQKSVIGVRQQNPKNTADFQGAGRPGSHTPTGMHSPFIFHWITLGSSPAGVKRYAHWGMLKLDLLLLLYLPCHDKS